MKYGLIGEKLGHSLSKRVHEMIGGYAYDLYPIGSEELPRFLADPKLGGCNVTIPYKQAVMPLCDALCPRAQAIGSVNTIVRREDGSLLGDNTDIEGFLYLARRSGIDLAGRHVLILGSGGTEKTLRCAAGLLGAKSVQTVSLRRGDPYAYAKAEIIVNTTPVGMYPKGAERPVDLARFPHCLGVLDVIYNPLRSCLVQQALSLGIPTAGGLPMLVAQALASSALFLGKEPDLGVDATTGSLEKELTNLIFVGMPGCGKSTVAALVAKALRRPLLDTDAMVAETTGRSPAEIISRDGEAAFRKAESEMIEKACAGFGAVIATGGGSVLRQQNRLAMGWNGRVYWLQRDRALLCAQGRPLSVDLPCLEAERTPLYRAVAGKVIQNDGTAAEQVLEDYHAYFGD